MRHYVWNEEHTALVEKEGEIDMSKPFFLFEERRPEPSEGNAWPEGWKDVGTTEDTGESAQH